MKRCLMLSLMLIISVVLMGCNGNGSENEDGESNEEANQQDGEEATEGGEENSEDVAGDFPERQIRYIVPYGPGGLSDITARINEQTIRENDMLDVDFTVTNIEGASAGNGMNEVIEAEADGHTLLHHHTSFITHELTGVRDWGFEEFEPIAHLFEVPHIIFSHSDRFETMDEFLEEAENNPETLSAGTSSPGGLTHINMLSMLNQLDIADETTAVTHGGGGDMNTAILGGENDIGFGQLPQSIEYHRSGDVNILAVASNERVEAIPDVPTFDEVGLDMDQYFVQKMGVWAPPETPTAVINELNDLFQEVVESEDYQEASEDQGFIPLFGDGETLYNTFEEDKNQLSELIERLEIN